MEVHNQLGPGLKEVAYHRAMSARMERVGLSFEEEKPVEIEMDGTRAGLLYLDHLVEGVVVVEEKALSHMLTSEEVAQVITYLAATDLPVGLLVNFGRRRLEYKRVLPPRKLEGWRDRIRRYLWQPSAS
jgi:GxxExxY protein